MPDDNPPTELELFNIMNDAATKLKIDHPDGFAKFMTDELKKGTNATDAFDLWKKSQTPPPADLPQDVVDYLKYIKDGVGAGKELKDLIPQWEKDHPITPPTKPIETKNTEITELETRLAALEATELAKRKAEITSVITAIKEVDKAFDEKQFVPEKLETVAEVETVLTSLNAYLGSIKRFKDTLPEIGTQMSLSQQNDLDAKRTKIMKDTWGVDNIDDIVKMI